MKKECIHTRKMLAKYIHGHLFKLEQMRIERHLRSCVVCYSQYQSLKRADETRKYLKDITPPEGMVQIVRESVSGLGKFKKVLYRPLWIAGIFLVLAGIIYFMNKPRSLDVEIDSIVKTAPSVTTLPESASPAQAAKPTAIKSPSVQQAAPIAAPAAAPEAEPLAITITIDDDKASFRRINSIMAGHGYLRKYKFTDTVREISGNLTAKELRTFFNRIASFGKAAYSRKRLEAFPTAHPLPFVIRLTVVPRPPEESAPATQPQPALKPTEAGQAPPQSAGTPGAQEAPKPEQHSAPTPSATQ